MYTTKITTSKNAVEMGSTVAHHKYISSGDPYIDRSVVLPDRWKKAQFKVDRMPGNAGNGYFGYNDKAYTYVSDPFKEMRMYSKEQKPETRKKGFGTADASKRDEFTASIRTEQYRETLKRENQILEDQRDLEAEAAMLEKLRNQPKEFAPGLVEPEFLYDIGKSQTTPFNPKASRETFFQRRPNKDLDPKKGSMRLGPYMTSSSAIGTSCWETPYEKPKFGTVSPTKNFHDKSHLTVPGF